MLYIIMGIPKCVVKYKNFYEKDKYQSIDCSYCWGWRGEWDPGNLHSGLPLYLQYLIS